MSDLEIRRAAFDWLGQQIEFYNDVIPRSVLEAGFRHKDNQIRLVGPQGIFKPQCMALPLTITTSPNSPYADAFGSDGLLRYKYRGTNIGHYENRGLAELMRLRVPLIYLHGIAPSRYVAQWPVFVVGNDAPRLTFTVAVDDTDQLRLALGAELPEDPSAENARRAYVTSIAKRRIHQQAFREKVLRAYKRQCALCRLKHEQLLDAAHITADADEFGAPVTSNGIALCKLHHAAFDRGFLAVRPDYRIEIRRDLMDETDGPMLKHGLQGLNGGKIVLPYKLELWPDQDRLARRYQSFIESKR